MPQSTLIIGLPGAACDLAWRLVVSALYDLYRDGGMPERVALIGAGHQPGLAGTLAARYQDGFVRFSRLGLGSDEDQSLFMRADQVTGAWLLPDPVLRSWPELATDFPNHAAGSWGPQSAERLINLDQRGRLKPPLPPT
jgi:glucose-6-phosphate 1-dehydrogenase